MFRINFNILKQYTCSAGNVIANYFDVEHVPIHKELKSLKVFSEGSNSALYELWTRPFGIPMRTLSYLEFRGPLTIYQFNKSLFYEMEVISEIKDTSCGKNVSSEALVKVEIRVVIFLYFFKTLIAYLAKKQIIKILKEDQTILHRRHKIYGTYLNDYLRDWQKMLFKDEFKKFYYNDHLKYENQNQE